MSRRPDLDDDGVSAELRALTQRCRELEADAALGRRVRQMTGLQALLCLGDGWQAGEFVADPKWFQRADGPEEPPRRSSPEEALADLI